MRAKQKQLEELKAEKEREEARFRSALTKIIDSDESLRIALNYSQKQLSEEREESFEEYSPIQISRMIFEKELESVREHFQMLPNGECRVEHFLVIMLRVLNFPLEKVPLYMVGLKDMFYQIAEEGKNSVSYPAVFKYLVGELVTMKEEKQYTQFQVRFEENKKQDYLCHEAGIAKIYYSQDLKVTISLDNYENMLKFYGPDMRNVSRYSASKDLHGGIRSPLIVDFDYSEMTMRLGLIYPDRCVESLHLPNFLYKTTKEFESTTLNQLTHWAPEKMRKIYYMQMLNKWLTLPESDEKVYLFDMEKVRLKPEEVEECISIDTNEHRISQVLQVVHLSTICLVAANEITFLDEKLKDTTFPRFSHHDNISILRFCEESSTFYLAGKEKAITLFTIQRNRKTSKIRTIPLTHTLTDFEIFPFLGTLVVADQGNEIRLIDEASKATQQIQSVANIVKNTNATARIQKMNKSQFFAFETYMTGYTQQKTAIEKPREYVFLPQHYYDPKKEELYISLNGQILSFSVLFGEVRKNISAENANMQPHSHFFMGPKTHLFIMDDSKSVYQVYMRTQEIEGENKYYKKRVGLVGDIVASFYDEEMRNLMVMGRSVVHQLRNDYNNNFNSINVLSLYGAAPITQCLFCPKTKYLTLMTQDQKIYQFHNYDTSVKRCYQFVFRREQNSSSPEKLIVQFEYCPQFELLLLLNNQNELVIAQKLNLDNHVVIGLVEYLPYRRRTVPLIRFSYHFFRVKNVSYPSVLLYDEQGWMVDINLQKIFINKFNHTEKEQRITKNFLQESYQIRADLARKCRVELGQGKAQVTKENVVTLKLHDRQIMLGIKLYLQMITTLTISKQGSIKLHNQHYQCLFSLKIPTLFKITWNMQSIQSIKNRKSLQELRTIMKTHYSPAPAFNPKDTLNRSKELKNASPMLQRTKFQDSLPLEIESKEVEDILLQEEDYRKSAITRGFRSKSQRYNPQSTAMTIDAHPWRHRRQFVRMYQRSSPPKNINNMPKELLTLRTSLDMYQRKKKTPDYSGAETILPQLRDYEVEKPVSRRKSNRVQEAQGIEAFESCVFLKSERRPKRVNELDEIDRQFFRKEILLRSKRWIPNKRGSKMSETIDLSESGAVPTEQIRRDTMRQIRSVFQQHNKECIQSKKGHVIRIPKLLHPIKP